jgi:hypothetical protein
VDIDEEFDEIVYEDYIHPDYLGYMQQIGQLILGNPGSHFLFCFK